MTKKTLCMLFVLAFIAQICAIPTDKDGEKEVEGVAHHAAAAEDEAKADASELAKKATHQHHTKHNTDDHAGGPKHGDEDRKKPGPGLGPAADFIKKSEKITEKLADKGVKLVTDILDLWKL